MGREQLVSSDQKWVLPPGYRCEAAAETRHPDSLLYGGTERYLAAATEFPSIRAFSWAETRSPTIA